MKWEYFDVTYDADAKKYIRSQLSSLGQEGWEMINFHYYTDLEAEWITFYFKRKIQQG